MCVADDRPGADHGLHEVRHAGEHLVGLVALGAVVDEQDGLHVGVSGNAGWLP